MGTIESLNKVYLIEKGSVSILGSLREKTSEILQDTKLSSMLKFRSCMELLEQTAKLAQYRSYIHLQNAYPICDRYRSCVSAIAGLKAALIELSEGKTNRIAAAQASLQRAQEAFDTAKAAFEEKYAIEIRSLDHILKMLYRAISADLDSAKERMHQTQTAAREALLKAHKVSLSLGDHIEPVTAPPTRLLVARYPDPQPRCELLQDMGYHASYQDVVCDLKEQGNILLDAAFENANDDAIVSFVLAYIFRMIDSYPVGSLNVHIFDSDPCALYQRLYQCFRTGDTGEDVRKLIQLHTSIKNLDQIKQIISEDIFPKTSTNRPDLYAVYEEDQSDTFQLIILADGLIGSNGYAANETLETLASLSKPNEIGHRCGIRFLIIDSSASIDQASLSDMVKHYTKEIRDHCSLQLEYYEGKLHWCQKEIEPLHITNDPELYIQTRGASIASDISSIERSIISIEEVASSVPERCSGSILSIPIGRSGTEVVSLPLSCRDEDGTVAGQCIGYMAIGQSGSGKSSFFHSIVLNGSLKYPPTDLQFWLLDFKYGGASSKYRYSQIPHIRIIAENNKIDDAVCLFQMIGEEIERRNKLFNQIGTADIIDYNKRAELDPTMEHLPRIIIAIDEVQEIFRDDNAAELQKMINAISVRMRSAGMHFIMIAQDLSGGKTYMLKEAFMPSASGRVCFRVAPDIPRESGFEEDFLQRKQEISTLKTGEAYFSYGKGTIKKVKMAYASPEEMSETYFAMIKARYPAYSDRKPLVIGSKKRLSIETGTQHTSGTYYDVMCSTAPRNGNYPALIGEDAYRMTPLFLQFSPNTNSTVLLLGDDKEIASSICTSVACALLRQKVRAHLFNGDKTKVQTLEGPIPHPFLSICQRLRKAPSSVQVHKLDQFGTILKDIYRAYLDRNRQAQGSDDDIPMFEPIFLIVNDLLSIDSYVQNEQIELGEEKEEQPQMSFFDLNAGRLAGQRQGSVQDMLQTLCTNGYRYNIHLVLAIKGSPAMVQRSVDISEAGTLILFNKTQFAGVLENRYLINELLKSISNGTDSETMAVSVSNHSYSKIRPIIYDLSVTEEADALTKLAGGIDP